ncbi:MAG: enoyl-CoA hydratase/isomerase family protein [Candidatus Sericytochromatia bacterium]|nr:enoyl-CoA hydratase/isomerase family protein [Candidatus Sericytochromatia bacterium]
MTVSFERRGMIGILSLDRPDKLNAMTHEMGDALQETLKVKAASPELRCLILRANGRAFSAGGDLDFLSRNLARDHDANERDMRAFYDKFLTIHHMPIPTLALVHGRATGAGLCLALACDVRILAEDAILSFNFTHLGLTPGMGGTWLLPRIVGYAKAADLAFSGRSIEASEAHRWGLAEYVVPPDDLLPQGLRWAERVARGAPEAVRKTKALLRANALLSLEEALAVEAQAQADAFAGRELPEGIRALKERRRPDYA